MTKRKPLHDRFCEYTEDELARIKDEVCLAHNCPYLSTMKVSAKKKGIARRGTVAKICNYLIMTQHSRGCMPDVCEYWKDREGDKFKKKKFNPVRLI